MPANLPRIAVENYFISPQTTLTAFHSELSGPPDFLRNQWPAKRWRSPYRTINIIAGKNDKLAFSYNGSNYVATITAGCYRWPNLMNEAATQMNTAAAVSVFSGSYDRDITRKPSLERSGALSFNLRCASATGTDKQNSIFPTLGYDCKADKSGAAADDGYEADYPSDSSFGRIEIYASGARQNNKLYYTDSGGAHTVTITTGVYNLKALFSELKYGMDTASSVTDYGVHMDDDDMLTVFDKGSGSFTLNTGAGSILPTLGDFTTGASATSHTALAVATHNYEVINIDLSGTLQLDLLAFIGHNLSEDSVVVLYGGNTAPSFASNAFSYEFTYDQLLMHKFPDLAHNGGTFTAPSYRYFQVEISDPTNEEFHVEAGHLWGSTYYTLSHNFDFGSQDIQKSNSAKGKTDGRNTTGQLRNQENNKRLQFKGLEDADKDELVAHMHALDTLRPALWCMLPEDDTWTIYGTLGRQELVFSLELNRWNLTIEIEQEL